MAAEGEEPYLATPELLTLVAGIATIGLQAYLLSPLLPVIARDLDVTIGRVGMVAGAYAIATGLSALFLGPVADRWPRPRVLALSMAFLAVGFLVCAAAPSLSVLAFGQAWAGLAAGVHLPMTYALAGDSAAPADRSRVLGRVLLGWSTALILGVPLGATVGAALGWRGTFATMAGLALVMALFQLRLRERRVTPAAKGGTLSILRERAAWPWWTVGLLNMIAFYATYTYLGARMLETLGWQGAMAAIPAMLYGAGFAVIGLVGGVIDRLGAARALVLGQLLLALVYGSLPLASTVTWMVAAAMLAFGVGQHFALNGFMSLLGAVDPARRGALMAINSAVTYLGYTIGAAAVGPLVDRFGFLAATSVSTLASLGALAVALARRQGQRSAA